MSLSVAGLELLAATGRTSPDISCASAASSASQGSTASLASLASESLDLAKLQAYFPSLQTRQRDQTKIEVRRH